MQISLHHPNLYCRAAAALGFSMMGAALLAQTIYPDKTIERIAFGSCAHQDKPQPILEQVVAKRPDVFVYLGDNIYGDTEDMAVLEAKYRKLGDKPEFQQLRQSTTLLAVWDDHDYGTNDAGRYYCCKEQSKALFLDFWQEPPLSERRQHAGIYHSVSFGAVDRRVQFILLDTRTFRQDLLPNDKKKGHKNDYRPHTHSSDSTLLGAEQWAWLETQLHQPAQLRIIATSNQFSHEYNGWESWTNFPAEQQRMIHLIKKTKANGVVFISGDVHWGELSKRPVGGGYPLYDVTSSGITQEWATTEPNRYRVGEVVRNNNFGWIEIDWSKTIPDVRLELYDVKGEKRVEERFPLSTLHLVPRA